MHAAVAGFYLDSGGAGEGGEQGESADIIMFRVVSYAAERDGNITEPKWNRMSLGWSYYRDCCCKIGC